MCGFWMGHGRPHWPFARQDHQRCSVGVVLSFLQEKLERRLSPSTLKVYVVAIAADHDAVEGVSLGKHHLIVRFLRGARRLNPPRPHLIPSWDLSVVLLGLRKAPFEPFVSVELKYLSLKTLLLIALTSIKKVGDLHAFSVNETCLEFGPADSHVTLRPRPGCVPKVPTTPFRDQVAPPEEADPALAFLCPVSALRTYVDRTRSFRHSEQLFVCFGGQQKVNAVSKQRLAHWVLNSGSSLPPQFRLRRSSLDCAQFSSSCSAPPNGCFRCLASLVGPLSGIQGVGKSTTQGECLGYICNPCSLKEGTETLCPLATILDCAGALCFSSTPQHKSEERELQM
ncbi:hypothetical protein H4Q32_008775 [Labeo rohita]|uniref:Uncharacterized protein n=1 Tax=Labeo rohita TaxID=84645 RepID=A0ABQ8M484_LABRO|nr:hypothetical protein H4Q32_008775 [Labeo rohita]